MKSTSFPRRGPTGERFGGLCAVLAGIVIFLYSVAFVIIARSAPGLAGLLSALFLMLSGLLSTAALVALYLRLRETDAAFALWALLLTMAGALGSAIHGGYDLANAIPRRGPMGNPPDANLLSLANLPNQVDPRGLLTFGVAGVGLFVVAWLMGRGAQFPNGLGYLGYGLAVLLVILYLGRLIVLRASSPLILVPAVLAGFLANPVWYIWLGITLLGERK